MLVLPLIISLLNQNLRSSKKQKERKEGNAFFANFERGSSGEDDDKEEQEEEEETVSLSAKDKTRHLAPSASLPVGGGQREQRIVKEECRLNKEVASSSSSSDGSFLGGRSVGRSRLKSIRSRPDGVVTGQSVP